MNDDREYVIKWIELESDYLKASMLYEIESGKEKINEIRWKMLKKKWNIDPISEDEKPLHAWLRYLHEINGLPFQMPADSKITQMILENPGAQRFMFFLA